MLSNINFKDYTNSRIDFYNKLAEFSIDQGIISEPIILDQSFFENLELNFSEFLVKRITGPKFTSADNRLYKQQLKIIFPQLMSIFNTDGPVVYWFKINYTDNLTNDKILAHYHNMKNKGKNKGWWTQVNMSRTHPTEILYVGKVERSFQNRFIQHIGLGHNFTTALKLQRWITGLKGMSVTLHYLALSPDMAPYLEDVENVIWRELKPLLGASPRIK